MSFENDHYVNEIVESIIESERDIKNATNSYKKFKRLIATGTGINTVNSKAFTATMLVAARSHVVACQSLVVNGAYPEDCIYGAAFAGNLHLVSCFKTMFKISSINHNRLAIYAMKGGHPEQAKEYLQHLPEGERDYLRVALAGLFHGHYEASLPFIAAIPAQSRNYSNLAASAAMGGHLEVAKTLLANIPEAERNYEMIISTAERYHESAVASYFREQLRLAQSTVTVMRECVLGPLQLTALNSLHAHLALCKSEAEPSIESRRFPLEKYRALTMSRTPRTAPLVFNSAPSTPDHRPVRPS